MIKEIIQLYWHEQANTEEGRSTISDSMAVHWREGGMAGLRSYLHEAHTALRSDLFTYDILEQRFLRLRTRLSFVIVFLLALFYIMVMKAELYESRSALIVRDLATNTEKRAMELSFLGTGPSSQLQDSKVVEEYLQSLEVYRLLDKAFDLTEHYKSDALDIFERLDEDATMEEVLAFYRKRLSIRYDELSGILHIAYAHTDPKIAQDVLAVLLERVEQALNEFNRRRARKQLAFIEEEYERDRAQMDASGAKLEAYQNEHLLLDPKDDAASSSTIIAELEASLAKKQIELAKLSAYLTPKNYEIITLRKEIASMKQAIAEKKHTLSGGDTMRLNKVLFEFERLKMQFEFDVEVYKNTLLQLETTRLDAHKAAKTLSIVSEPNLPDGYTYPDRPKALLTLLIVTLLLYGIYAMLSAIIKDHKD